MVAKSEIINNPPLYRVWQFFQALFARPLSETDLREIRSVLSPAQQALFIKMSVNDQQHSLGVMRHLYNEGHRNPDVLIAALLHDVGKAYISLGLIERSLVVLAHFLRPSLAQRWGCQEIEDSSSWKRPFIVYEKHPAWGAEMAKAVGCSPLTVKLIRFHHQETTPPEIIDPREMEFLNELLKADNAN
ncbi:MAG: HD domain-containing protein [Anaerolineales bacterium]|nr:HD domain-containing protein [Anaerolineales bacterium]